MADVEKININNTDYDIADAKALRNKDTANTSSFVDTRAGTTQYPTTGENYNNTTIIGKEAYTVPTSSVQTTILGNNAYSNSQYSTVYSYGAHTNGVYTTALGRTANANANYATTVGDSAYANSLFGTAIGANSQIATGNYGTLVGTGAYTNKDNATAVGMNTYIAGVNGTAVGYNATISSNSSGCSVFGARSSIPNTYTYYSTAIGCDAKVNASYSVQLGNGINNNYGSLQFKDYPLVDSNGKIYEERIPSTVKFATDEPTVLEWQDDEELRKLIFMYTGTDNDLFKHGLCYQATPKQGHPKFWCGYTYTDYIPRQECVQVDNEKLFLKLAEISRARYFDDGNWANSLVGGDNSEQSFYFYYNVNDAQWRIEISNDTIEMGFAGGPDYYYFEQGETLEDFGIYVKNLTLPTDEGADEEMFDIYYYAPVYCDGYDFGSDKYSVNYMKMMEAMNDSDWGFGWVIDNMESWEYTVPGRGTDPGYTYYMPIIPETYVSIRDGDEYEGVTVRWEWDDSGDGSWKYYINGENTGYEYTTSELENRYGIVLDVSEVETEYIEFYFRGAKQLYWEQFNPIDETEFAKQEDLDALETEVQPLFDWKVNTVTLTAPNLNNYTTPGWYFFESAPSATNRPGTCGTTFMMLVLADNDGNHISQYIFATHINLTAGGSGWGAYAPMVFHRQRFFNSWISWRTQLSDGASAPYIRGFDDTKKQVLVHNASSPELYWTEESGSGSGADVDLSNISDTAKITISHNAMPSSTYEDLTLGANDTQYTMPSNGWLIFAKRSSGSGSYGEYGNLNNLTTGLFLEQTATYRTNVVSLLMPVKKGDVIAVGYNLNGATVSFRFYYAQGSESEAS